MSNTQKISAMANTSIEKLKDDNYAIWSETMKALFEKEKCIQAIQEVDPKPTKFDEMGRAALCNIRLLVEGPILLR